MTTAKKQPVKKTEGETRYSEGVGRRKTAVARVRIYRGGGEHAVNGKKIKEYFLIERFIHSATSPLSKLQVTPTLRMEAKVHGGGVAAQADAVRLGLSRALVKHDAELKRRLRGLGFLTRDPRMVERKKYGLKKARRAPQWAKR
ncbi:MAG: 30S ribosomal protein S9 [Candidatus Liptonbacteria bacterium]|nr:30S ribosomal protein S9 [Candidatus Liptonbacteria bacterium]